MKHPFEASLVAIGVCLGALSYAQPEVRDRLPGYVVGSVIAANLALVVAALLRKRTPVATTKTWSARDLIAVARKSTGAIRLASLVSLSLLALCLLTLGFWGGFAGAFLIGRG
jgi:hypothetical protein